MKLDFGALFLFISLLIIACGVFVVFATRGKQKREVPKNHSSRVRIDPAFDGHKNEVARSKNVDTSQENIHTVKGSALQIKRLRELSVEELSQNDSPSGKSRLSMLANMPVEQIGSDSGAILILTYIRQMLSTSVDEVSVGKMLLLIDSQQFTFNRKLAIDLARVLEALGFGIAPDPRLHGVKPQASGVVKVFSLAEYAITKVTNDFHHVVVIIHLTSMVSKADKVILESEKKITHAVIDSFKRFTPYEEKSLCALFDWCFNNSFGYRGIKRNIGKLSHTERLSVWRHLVNVAVVDEKLDVRELAELQKIYDVLDLDVAKKHLYLAAVSNAILTAGRVPRDGGFKGNDSNFQMTQISDSAGDERKLDGEPHNETVRGAELTGDLQIDHEQDFVFEFDDENDSVLHGNAGRPWVGSTYVVGRTLHSLDSNEDNDSSDWFDVAGGD